jgi:hypothetical protein
MNTRPTPRKRSRRTGPSGTLPATNTNTDGDNSASELIEAPQPPGRNPLARHDFADGGGSGGAEAFRRSRVKKK